MIIRVSASAVPDLRPARRLAGPAGPVNGVQGHRAACAAARGCRAAPHPSPTAPGLGRPRGPRRADPAPAPEPADAPAGQITPADLGRPGRPGRPPPPALHVAPLPADPDRHPAHAAALARRASKAALDIPAPDPWTAAHRPGDPPARTGDRPRQPGLGLPDLRRADRSRPQDRALHHLGGPPGSPLFGPAPNGP